MQESANELMDEGMNEHSHTSVFLFLPLSPSQINLKSQQQQASQRACEEGAEALRLAIGLYV